MSESASEKGTMEYCIDNLASKLSAIPYRSLLVNGNTEMQLKFLLASSHDDGNFWYAMDKLVEVGQWATLRSDLPLGMIRKDKSKQEKIIKGHQVDLIAFSGHKLCFVAETKCTFIWDTFSDKEDKKKPDSIDDAIKKASITHYLATHEQSDLWSECKNNHYIVHFLLVADPRQCVIDSTQERPLWISSKYKCAGYSPDKGKKLIEMAKKKYDLAKIGTVGHKSIIDGVLDVVWVKLNPASMDDQSLDIAES